MKIILLSTILAFTFTLFGQNKIESSVEEYYDGIDWNTQYGYNYVYDNNKNLINMHSYEWINSAWVKDGEVVITYNANNKISEEIEIGMDMNGQLVNIEKINYSYSASDELIQMLYYEWDGNQWVSYSRENFIYLNGKLDKIEFEEQMGSQWFVEERYNFTYNGNLLTMLTLEEYDGFQWEEFFKISLTYDSNNKRTNSIYEYFDGTIWEQFEEIDYTLDVNFNRIKKSLFYDGIKEFYVDYSYDFTEELSNYAHPFNYEIGIDSLVEDFPYADKILSYTGYELDISASTYYPSERVIFNYNSPLYLGTKENINNQNISLYPNPAANYIEICGISNGEKIKVLNNLGAVILEENVQDKDKIDIKNLNDGMYIVLFENGKTLKFVKK